MSKSTNWILDTAERELIFGLGYCLSQLQYWSIKCFIVNNMAAPWVVTHYSNPGCYSLLKSLYRLSIYIMSWSKNFHLYGNVTIAGKGLQSLLGAQDF
jgi:hypothetical protein